MTDKQEEIEDFQKSLNGLTRPTIYRRIRGFIYRLLKRFYKPTPILVKGDELLVNNKSRTIVEVISHNRFKLDDGSELTLS